MSGQEEQQEQEHHDNVERFVDLMMMASVASPVRSSNLLDYLYLRGVPISISPLQQAGGGAAANNWNDIESAAAAILNRSLYDRHPVKKVITEEARSDIVDKKFTIAMVEELKINGVCGIWQEEFEDGEDIKILPCNHAFKSVAIMKWLEEEKAECPVCRFCLKSKEVNENQNRNLYHDDDHDNDDNDHDYDGDESEGEEEGEEEVVDRDADADAAAQDNDVIRVNNVASRLIQSVAGRVNQPYHNHSVAMPMNQLLQSVRMLSSSSRLREPIHVGREVRAEAIQHAAAHAAHAPRAPRAPHAPHAPHAHHALPLLNNLNLNPNNNNNLNNNNNNHNNNNNNNNYNIINNNYYYYDYDRNIYHIDVDEVHQDIVSNQEQVDIEEAIRRSLEQS